MGLGGEEDPLTSLMGFFGDGAGKKLAEAGDVLKGRSNNLVYHRPGDKPIELPKLAARVFVLGPPRDLEMIGKSDPSKKKSEVFELADTGLGANAFAAAVTGHAQATFGARYVLPLPASKGISFFDRHYWSNSSIDTAQDREETTQDWRRIDSDWLGAATSLALKLDRDTNNTSLVLAMRTWAQGQGRRCAAVRRRCPGRQLALSWQEVEWKDYGGRRITGPDLLRRTRLYKVGHHARPANATLRAELGLDLMGKLRSPWCKPIRPWPRR